MNSSKYNKSIGFNIYAQMRCSKCFIDPSTLFRSSFMIIFSSCGVEGWRLHKRVITCAQKEKSRGDSSSE